MVPTRLRRSTLTQLETLIDHDNRPKSPNEHRRALAWSYYNSRAAFQRFPVAMSEFVEISLLTPTNEEDVKEFVGQDDTLLLLLDTRGISATQFGMLVDDRRRRAPD